MPEPDPAQGQQVIIGVDVDQHRLMPCIAQKLGPAMCLRANLVRDRLTIQLPRAAGLRRVREVLQRRAEGLRFLSEDPVSDQHEGVSEMSGGEGQELIAFNLGGALRYRLGEGGQTPPTYGCVVLDEGFVKDDSDYTGRALRALQELGFQLIVGAPRGEGHRV